MCIRDRYELVKLIPGEVADGPEVEAFFRPVTDIIALDRLRYRAGMLGAQSLRDEQIDHVFSTLIDDRGHRLAIDVIETAAEERKALRRQVDNGW